MHTTTLRADLEEVQAVHSCDELLVDEFNEDVIVLHDRRPEKQLQSKELRSEPRQDFIVRKVFQALRSKEEEAILRYTMEYVERY